MQTNSALKIVSGQKFNGGPWNQEECLKYLIFLDQNKIIMASRQKKKHFRVFDQMSEFVQTRSSLQCRSHHQKAIEKYKQVKKIIIHQKQQIDQKTYRLQLKVLRQKAKINQEYEKVERPRNSKQNVVENNQNNNQKEYSFQLRGIENMPNFFYPIQYFNFQMTPFSQNPLLANYIYYPFFTSN